MLRFIFALTLLLLQFSPLHAASTSPLPTASAMASPPPAKSSSAKTPSIKTAPENPPAAIAKVEAAKNQEASGGQSSESDPYTIRGVKVDVTADSSMKARDKAFAEGQQKAFEILAKNISEGDSAGKYDEVQIGRLVKSFEVQSERASGTRYTATLTYHFKPQQTAALLGKDGAEVSDDPYNKPKKHIVSETPEDINAAHTLVLPILRGSDKSILWEEKTPWHRAWENALSDYPSKELILPEGGMEDVGSITASEALAGLNTPLMRIMHKYQATSAIVAVLLTQDLQPKSNQNLSIQMARFDMNGRMQGTTTLPFAARPTAKEMEWLQSGVMNAVGAWREARAKTPPSQTTNAANSAVTPMPSRQFLRVPLTVPFANMEEWAAKRQNLESIPGMASLIVMRMNRYRAIVQLDYTGAQSQLDQALSNHNLQIMPTSPPDGTYMLISSGQPITPSPSMTAPAYQGQPVFRTVYPEPQQQPAPQPMPQQAIPQALPPADTQPVQIQQPHIQPIGQPELIPEYPSHRRFN